MKRPAKAPHKPHMSRAVLLSARSPDIDSARRAADAAESGTDVDGARARALAQASERVFAAVRPGFVAPCMVEAPDSASGRLSGPRCPVWPARVGAPTGLAVAANLNRATRIGRISRIGLICRRPPGSLTGDLHVQYCASRNRQREYLAESRGMVWSGVGRIAAITARESADAQDLLLATLGS
jgi:hypothetical protein